MGERDFVPFFFSANCLIFTPISRNSTDSLIMKKRAIIVLYSVSLILLLMAILIGSEKRSISIPIILLIVCATIGVRLLLEKKDKQYNSILSVSSITNKKATPIQSILGRKLGWKGIVIEKYLISEMIQAI